MRFLSFPDTPFPSCCTISHPVTPFPSCCTISCPVTLSPVLPHHFRPAAPSLALHTRLSPICFCFVLLPSPVLFCRHRPFSSLTFVSSCCTISCPVAATSHSVPPPLSTISYSPFQVCTVLTDLAHPPLPEHSLRLLTVPGLHGFDRPGTPTPARALSTASPCSLSSSIHQGPAAFRYNFLPFWLHGLPLFLLHPRQLAEMMFLPVICNVYQ